MTYGKPNSIMKKINSKSLRAILVGTFLVSAILHVFGAEPVTETQAIEIANTEIVKHGEKLTFGKPLHEFDVVVDKGERYITFREFRAMGETEESRKTFKQVDGKLQGRTYWGIYYTLRGRPGQIIADGGIQVFVDGNTGEVIEILRNGVSVLD